MQELNISSQGNLTNNRIIYSLCLINFSIIWKLILFNSKYNMSYIQIQDVAREWAKMEQLPPRNIYFATHPSKQAHILNSDGNLKDSNPFVSILIQDAILLSDLSPMCTKRFYMKKCKAWSLFITFPFQRHHHHTFLKSLSKSKTLSINMNQASLNHHTVA